MKVRAEQFAADLSKVDWSKVPASMKQDGEQLIAVAAFYAEGGDFKAGIDNYVAALNAQLSKAKPKAVSRKAAPGNGYVNSAIRVLDYPKYVIGFNGKRNHSVIFLKENYDGKGNYTGPSEVLSTGDAAFYALGYEAYDNQTKAARAVYISALERFMNENSTAKKATGSKSGRHQSKAEAATAREAYHADKRKAEAGEFAKMSRNEVLEIAQRVHKNRRLAAQVVDEAVDHKKRLTPTPENLVRWMKEPGKYDLIGIDTFEKNNPTADLKIKKEIFWARLLKK